MRLRRSMEEYKGLHIGCAPGTHAALAAVLQSHATVRKGVLDIGAHAGALLCRLRDLGYTDLMGVDLDETRFDLPGAAFRRVDLNVDFAAHIGRTFNVVTATDVIEHLDNPRHFLTEVHSLLAPGGLLGLSFPNIAFWEGRIKFILTGELWGFGARNYRAQRHISPMTFEQSGLLLREIGFDVLAQFSAGSFATPMRRVLTAPLWLPLRAIGGPRTMGESTIILARRAEPDPSLKSPTHYRQRWNGEPDRIGLDT